MFVTLVLKVLLAHICIHNLQFNRLFHSFPSAVSSTLHIFGPPLDGGLYLSMLVGKGQYCGEIRIQGRTQGGRKGLPLGGFGPLRAEGPRLLKFLRRHPKPTQKSRKLCGYPQKTRPDSRGPSDHLGLPRKRAHQKNRAPLSIRGTSEYQGPLNNRTPLNIRGPLSHQGPSEPSGVL